MASIQNDWLSVVSQEFRKPYYKELYEFVCREYQEHTVYPPASDIFNAFHYTPLSKVKVVILGQDPYHNIGQAHGLSFSVQVGQEIPPSLVNIYKELQDDLGCYIPNHGCLKKWADQGVLLLNTVLTVRAHQAFSHQGKGWEMFTDAVVAKLAEQREHLVFLLWGSYARRKGAFINRQRHLVLEAPHPSPLSAFRGFIGCGHFRKANEYLAANGCAPIAW